MIRPSLTVDGLAVRIPRTDAVAAVLDDLATAFAADPDRLAALLTEHAANVTALDHAATSSTATDYGRQVAAATADGSREALLDEAPTAAAGIDDVFEPDEVFAVIDRLAAVACRAHHNRTRNTRSTP